ncbi:MAG: hypothetical protein JST35_04335 [Armatimonadetes bacterium]|nr:hypothetical protein [Armatimonadota bacterium]
MSRKVAADNLKVCCLCGAVNASSNVECFVCRWHGAFEQDPEIVESHVSELIGQCPELLNTPFAERLRPTPWWTRVRNFFVRHFTRRVDLRV